MSIAIAFATSSGFVGAVVRLWDWTDVAHAAIEIGPKDGGIEYIDSTRARGVAKHVGLAGTILHRHVIQCSDQRRARALDWAEDQIGAPYDWAGIWGTPWPRDWRNPGAWLCGDFALRFTEILGAPIVAAFRRDRITPHRLRKTLTGHRRSWVAPLGRASTRQDNHATRWDDELCHSGVNR